MNSETRGIYAAKITVFNNKISMASDSAFKMNSKIEELYDMVPDGAEHIDWHNKINEIKYSIGFLMEILK